LVVYLFALILLIGLALKALFWIPN